MFVKRIHLCLTLLIRWNKPSPTDQLLTSWRIDGKTFYEVFNTDLLVWLNITMLYSQDSFISRWNPLLYLSTRMEVPLNLKRGEDALSSIQTLNQTFCQEYIMLSWIELHLRSKMSNIWYVAIVRGMLLWFISKLTTIVYVEKPKLHDITKQKKTIKC